MVNSPLAQDPLVDRYKDVCKRDLKAGDIAPTDLEALAADQNVWRLTTKSAAVKIEQKLKQQHSADE